MAKKAKPVRRPAKAAAARKSTAKAKPATKAKAKQNPLDMPGGVSPNREHQISIRRIKNGYIVRESGMVGTGMKARYVESEVFSKTAPKVTIPKR